jgi:hypothetical protein
VALETVPRTVSLRPSNPFRTNRKDRQKPVFLFGGEGSLPSVSHTHFIKCSSFPRDFSIRKNSMGFFIAKMDI